ncbi:MAG: flagellar biosynthetic protein FliR [Candidatus Margulisiibacteriota bacterium]
MIRTDYLFFFFLILARIAGIFIQAPIFSSRSFPVFAKSALAIWLAVVLWFVIPISPVSPTGILDFLISLIFEIAIGFTLGFVCNLLFVAIQSAGELMDLQMGLSVASALDPIFGAVISIIGRLAFYLALILFITANGHHMILSALHQSFSLLPVGKMANFASPSFGLQMISFGSMLWMTAIKLAAPVILLVFISDFTFGIVSRVAPQVNVFMLGFQVKPLLGLVGILFTLPFIVKYINSLIFFIGQQMILLVNNVK